jgi:hypothetical protein
VPIIQGRQPALLAGIIDLSIREMIESIQQFM